jgi:hypothetical protein
MKNKKGGITTTIIDIIVILLFIFALYIIYKNFSGSCILNNIKHFSNWNMHNCIYPKP